MKDDPHFDVLAGILQKLESGAAPFLHHADHDEGERKLGRLMLTDVISSLENIVGGMLVDHYGRLDLKARLEQQAAVEKKVA
jgi:hypothetical protein